MKHAAQAALTAEDVKAILGKQVDKAKDGDAAAAKFVLGFVASQGPAPEPVQKVKVIEKVKVIDRGGKRKKAAGPEAPPRVVAAAPGPRPTGTHLRKLVALFLIANGNTHLTAMAAALELPADQLRAVLQDEWFIEKQGTWFVTAAGRKAFE